MVMERLTDAADERRCTTTDQNVGVDLENEIVKNSPGGDLLNLGKRQAPAAENKKNSPTIE